MSESTWQVLRDAYQASLKSFLEFIPSFAAALLLLVIGLVVAKLAEVSVRRIVKTFGVDTFCERRAVLQPLRSIGFTGPASLLLSRLVFWVVVSLTLIATVGALRLPYLSGLLSQFVSFLPRLISSIVIFLAGMVISRLFSRSIESTTRAAGLEYASGLATSFRYFLNLLVTILSLAQAGVNTEILTMVFTVLVVSLGLAIALALGLGSRSVVNNLLAGAFARELFSPGNQLEIQGKSGRLIAIRAVGATFESDGRQFTVPNTMLIENIVE